jgi:phage protein D
MSSTYQLLLGGKAADPDLMALMVALDVDESMDLPGALQLEVPVSRTTAGEYTYISDDRFEPLASIAVVASPPAASADPFATGGTGQCIFDGVVLSHKIRLMTGTSQSSLTVWAQDVTWLMNLQEKTREWIDLTDADVAAAIFDEYGILPAGENTDADSPSHTESGHSLMQRGSDIQFLRMLARRSGKLCRVVSDAIPGVRTGYFAKPSLDGQPQVRINLNDPQNWTVGSLDLEWDATKPTSVVARQALFTSNDASGVSGDTSDSGLTLLAKRGLADFTQKAMTVLLAAPVDDAGELTQRAQAVLREADWFVRAVGEADVERLGAVLRAGMLVALDGIGQLHSGTYLVWSVRHRITRQAHAMKFTLVRNAVGSPPGGTAGIPGVL